MALTRAQLLMGDINNGAILSGQPQGVRPGGNGITIRTDGVIEVNSQTIVGVMKLGQTAAAAAAAFNGYTWPTGPGSNRQQLTTDGTGILIWEDADHIPWSAKGQLIVGTGVETDIILNVGANTSLLVADSSTASGLNYTDQIQTAILLPTGTSLQRPLLPNLRTGQFRWNTDLDSLEVYDGTDWEAVASEDPTVGTFVPQTVPASPTTETGSAVIPPGTTAERQTLPVPTAGNFRWNTDFQQLEVFDGISWAQLPASTNFDYVLQTRPPSGQSPSAVIPSGNFGQRQTPALGGYLRYDTSNNFLEFHNGTSWEVLAPSGGGVHSFVQAGTPVAFNPGDLWYDTVLERESVWDGGAWVQPGVTQTGPTGAAQIPFGPTGSQPAGAPGLVRYNTSIDTLEFWNVATSSWGSASGFPPGTRLVFQQTAAPVGWVKDTTYNNYAMRIVNGAVGTGGTVGFTTAFASGLNSGGTAITIAQMPSHSHGASDPGHNHTVGNTPNAGGNALQNGIGYTLTGGLTSLENVNVSINNNGGGQAHNHTLPSFNVQYVDFIIATKS